MRVCLFILMLGLVGCSSAPYMLPESDTESEAPGEAFAADSMMFRKEMPDHRDQKKFEFYYKHCSMNGDEEFFSKTSYDCTGPY